VTACPLLKLSGYFHAPCESFILICCDCGGSGQRGETSCLLFLLPRVDITSKTWPSLPTCCYVDGEKGEHLRGERMCFSASHSHGSAGHGGKDRQSPRSSRCSSSVSAVLRFHCNFYTPRLFLDFDLGGSVMKAERYPW
ncbi:hypothetical protein GOODEAATRI_001223, partial [Goodea atripinnis]